MLFRVLPFFFLAASASTIGLFGTTIVESCTTYLGKQTLCNVPKYTRTETVFKSPTYSFSTTTPLVTTTLLPSTQTISLTKITTLAITESTITNTFLSTSTIFSTTIDTIVVSETVTSTTIESLTTTITSLTTIPTLTGFLPVADTTATAYPEVQLRKREREFSHIRDFSILKRNLTFLGGPKEAQSIECIVSIEIHETLVTVFTAKSQTKTITPMPIRTTTTILQASTSTLAPSLSLTLSFSTTLIVTSTLTTTMTFTTTTTSVDFNVVTTTITSYAACASDNLLSSVDSSSPNIDGVDGVARTYRQSSISLDSATDCCVTCQEAGNCLAFAWTATYGGFCIWFSRASGTCPATASTASQSGASMYYNYKDSPRISYTVGNGICGYLYNGGPD